MEINAKRAQRVWREDGLRVPERQAIAIGMEIGIHNGTLAIAIATTVLGRDAMALPPAIYSIVMFFTAAAFGALVQRRRAETLVESDVVA